MIELRDAQFQDYASIAKLHAESWRQNYRGIHSDSFLNNKVDQNRLNTWYKRLQSPESNQHVIVAMQQENIVGFSCFLLNDDPVFGSLLDNLHVSLHVQKSGIGKLLMKECARRICEQAESNQMYLWVYELNENARRVYERLGGIQFETVEKQTEDGKKAQVCRYTWQDVSVLI